jgi:hypothetical protein
MKARLVRYTGIARCISFARDAAGESPGWRFFWDELDDDGRIQMDKLFKWMGDLGHIANDQKFKHVSGKLWEFKSHQIRMLCFRSGDAWVITHGFLKKQDKIPPVEITLAERIMDEDQKIFEARKKK